MNRRSSPTTAPPRARCAPFRASLTTGSRPAPAWPTQGRSAATRATRRAGGSSSTLTPARCDGTARISARADSADSHPALTSARKEARNESVEARGCGARRGWSAPRQCEHLRSCLEATAARVLGDVRAQARQRLSVVEDLLETGHTEPRADRASELDRLPVPARLPGQLDLVPQ